MGGKPETCCSGLLRLWGRAHAPNGSYSHGRSDARSTARRDLGQLPSGQRKRHRKPGAMYLNHSRGFSDRSARIGNGRHTPSSVSPALCAHRRGLRARAVYRCRRGLRQPQRGCPPQRPGTSVRVGSTLQNLIDDQELTDAYDAGDLLAVDDSVLTRHGGEKLSVKVDGKRIKQGKWKSRAYGRREGDGQRRPRHVREARGPGDGYRAQAQGRGHGCHRVR